MSEQRDEWTPERITRHLMIMRSLLDAIVEAVNDAGPLGVPAGHIYAILLAYGCPLHAYEQIIVGLVNAKRIDRRGDVLYGVVV